MKVGESMINKRNFFTLLTAVAISGVLVICTMAQNVRDERIIAKSPPEIVKFEPVFYVVKEYEGQLAVFKGNSETPCRLLDCDFYMLSDADKEMFSEGITVKTDAELVSLIEDYTS